MAADNDNILADNGIFRSKKSNELVCLICTRDTSIGNWQKHIDSPGHIGTLRRFNLTFDKRDSKLVCKGCAKEMEWHALKDHAAWHSIVPWHEPTARYKHFFENYFQEWDASFYCHLCDKIFPEWSNAWIHTGERTHLNLVESASRPNNDSAVFGTIETVYELLVSEAFVPWSATSARCKVCNLSDVRLRDIFSHIRAPQHSALHSDFLSILQKRSKTEFSIETSDSTKAASSLVSESSICIYVVKQNATDYYCKLCDLKLIGCTSVDYHVTSEWHITTMKKYACEKIMLRESGDYYCECCDETIRDTTDVRNHVKGNGHANALSGKREMPTIDDEINVVTPTEKRHFLSDYIARFPNGDYCCRICNVLLSDIVLVEDHIVAKLHETTVKRYGCDDNIALTKDDKYHCLCCNHDIPRVEDIYSHTLSNEHKYLLNDANARQLSRDADAIQKTESMKITEITSISVWYVEKLNDKEFRCNICDIALPAISQAVDKHISGDEHVVEFKRYRGSEIVPKDDNAFYCKICECEWSTRESVTAHVKSAHAPNLTEQQDKNNPLREFEESSKNNSIVESSNEDPISPVGTTTATTTTPDDHKAEKSSVNPLLPYGGDDYISPMGGNRYWCACCESVIPSLQNLFGHTTSGKHKSFAKPIKTNETTSTFAPNSTCMYIVNLNDTEFHCKVCDLVLSGQIAVNEHAAGEQHKTGLERDGCFNITQVNETHYQCKYCNCRIIGLANVYLHIKGIRHRESMLKARRAQKESTIKSRDDVISSKSRDLESIVDDRADEKSNSLLRYGGDKYIKPINMKEYWCECCKTVIPSLQNIFGHTTSSRHKHSIIGPTKNSFPNSDASIASSVCRYIAKLHNTDYHCEVCDLVLTGQTMVTDHAASGQHIAALKRYSCDNVVLGEGIDYYCKSCQCKIPGIANVYLHIKGNRHRDSSRYSASNNDDAESTSLSINGENSQGTTRNSSIGQKIFADQSTQSTRSNTSSPASRRSSTAFATETRASSLNRNTGYPYVESFMNNKYRCTRCDCIIPTFENIYVHITGMKHKYFTEDSTKQPTTALPTSFCCYIVKFNETNFQCKICDVSMYDRKTVEDHAAGELHAKARQRYGCENITPNIDNYSYHCRSCKCRIPNLANVYLHLKGSRHIAGMANAKFSRNSEATGNTTIPEVPKKSANVTARSIVNRAENYIVSINVTDFLCQICNLSMTGLANADKHLAGKSHATAREEYGCDNITPEVLGKYNCRCCDCEIPNLGNVYRHVKGYRHTLNVLKQQKMAANNVKKIDYHGAANNIKEITNDRTEIGMIDGSLNGDGKFVSDRTVDGNALSASGSLNNINAGNASEKINTSESVSSDTSRPDLATTLGIPRKLRIPKKLNSQKNATFINYDDAGIYELNDFWKDAKIGMQLCLVIDDNYAYCFVCRENIEGNLSNCFEHLRAAEHCEALKTMVNYHATFDGEGEFSDYDLALQYMEEISEDEIHCFVCADYIANSESALQKHWLNVKHTEMHRKKQTEAQQRFETIKSKTRCDWYNVHVYRCEPCGVNFFTELGLSKHLKFNGHTSFVNDNQMIYDHCSRCSILWYGPRETYSKFHCHIPTHRLILIDASFVSPDLPKSAKLFVAHAANLIENMLPTSFALDEKERRKNTIVIGDLERVVKSQFPSAKAHVFGSRGCTVNLPDSDIDVFLDSGEMYEGNASSMDRMEFVTRVEKCLSEESRIWEMVQLATKSPSNFSIIRAQHRETGLYCNLSFENGLCVESANIIATICKLFPLCRKAIIFLKQWMELCGLRNPEGISSYALCWYVIFVMQVNSTIPSIAEIIERGKSRKIAGWQVGVTPDIVRYFAIPSFDGNTRDIVLPFFEYYANFDYRYEVACPLIGHSVQKRDFVDPSNLPNSMDVYKTYTKNANDPEPFRIDSALCLQDPFDLQRNLTKDVKKSYLSNFRRFCAKSAKLLRASSSDEAN